METALRRTGEALELLEAFQADEDHAQREEKANSIMGFVPSLLFFRLYICSVC